MEYYSPPIPLSVMWSVFAYTAGLALIFGPTILRTYRWLQRNT
jgi:hypothetical protein